MTQKSSRIIFALLLASAASASTCLAQSSADSSSSSSASSSSSGGPLGAISATPLGVCSLATSAQTAVPRKTRCTVEIAVTDSDGNRLPSQKFKFEARNIGGVKWKKLGEGKTSRRGTPKVLLFRVEQSASYRATADLDGNRRVDTISTPFDVYVQGRTRSSSSSSSSSSRATSSGSSSSEHSENESSHAETSGSSSSGIPGHDDHGGHGEGHH